jgi:hypothetical protein
MRHLSALLKRILRRSVASQTRKFSPPKLTELRKRTAWTVMVLRDRLFVWCDKYSGALE